MSPAWHLAAAVETAPGHVDHKRGQHNGQHDDDHVETVIYTCKNNPNKLVLYYLNNAMYTCPLLRMKELEKAGSNSPAFPCPITVLHTKAIDQVL